MLEHPKNFEEAKIIIKNSVNDDYYGNKRRIALLRLLFSLGVGLGLGTSVELFTSLSVNPSSFAKWCSHSSAAEKRRCAQSIIGHKHAIRRM